jgi:hypothetical protein
MPNPSYVDGYCFDSLLINPDLTLEYLVNRFKDLGGVIIQKEVQNLNECLEKFQLVINCSGLGARKLCNDEQVRFFLFHVERSERDLSQTNKKKKKTSNINSE